MRIPKLRAEFVLAVAVVSIGTPGLAQQPRPKPVGSSIDGGAAPYDPPMLDLLFAPEGARPDDLHVSVKIERFRANNDGWSVPVVLSIPAEGLAPTPATGSANAGAVDYCLSVLAVMCDASDTPIAKITRTARFRADRADASSGGHVAIACAPPKRPLPPGSYRLRVCVVDPTGRHSSVVVRTFTLPEVPPASSPSLSSLVLAKYTEPAVAFDGADQFLLGTATRVVPDASGRVSKARVDRFALFYKVYGMSGVQYQARVQMFLAGKVVLSTPLTAIAPIEVNGEIAAAQVVGLEKLVPGAYRAVLQIFAPGAAAPLATALTPLVVDP